MTERARVAALQEGDLPAPGGGGPQLTKEDLAEKELDGSVAQASPFKSGGGGGGGGGGGAPHSPCFSYM